MCFIFVVWVGFSHANPAFCIRKDLFSLVSLPYLFLMHLFVLMTRLYITMPP